MSAAEITATRKQLKLTQVQFAQLLGVHPLTVSKWERGVLDPPPHSVALMESFGKAGKVNKDVGDVAAKLLLTAGVAIALLLLLKTAFPDEGKT